MVSISPVLHPRWLLLLKIEISLIGYYCFILSKNGYAGYKYTVGLF